MKVYYRLLYYVAFAMAVICTGLLVYNMAALPIYKNHIFIERATITMGGEMVILIGFILVLIFNIASILWVLLHFRQDKEIHKKDIVVLALGVLCLFLLMGDKVMVDEIGRELLLGWEVKGEYIILYVFLVIQLLYNIIILRRVYRSLFESQHGKVMA